MQIRQISILIEQMSISDKKNYDGILISKDYINFLGLLALLTTLDSIMEHYNEINNQKTLFMRQNSSDIISQQKPSKL